MCALCDKVNNIKDILNGYISDEELNELNIKIGLPGFDVNGSRLSLCLMAIVEMCIEKDLDSNHIHTGVEVAYVRAKLKKTFQRMDPDFEKKHSEEQWLKGFES